MIAKLAEGETPDIDPAECSSGSQSFSAMITKALKEGNFEYNDPSVLLKKMTKSENSGVRKENFVPPTSTQDPAPTLAKVIPFKAPEPESAPAPTPAKAPAFVAPAPAPAPTPAPTSSATFTVIFTVGGKDEERAIPEEEYRSLMASGALEMTLFGVYVRQKAPRKKSA